VFLDGAAAGVLKPRLRFTRSDLPPQDATHIPSIPLKGPFVIQLATTFEYKLSSIIGFWMAGDQKYACDILLPEYHVRSIHSLQDYSGVNGMNPHDGDVPYTFPSGIDNTLDMQTFGYKPIESEFPEEVDDWDTVVRTVEWVPITSEDTQTIWQYEAWEPNEFIATPWIVSYSFNEGVDPYTDILGTDLLPKML